MKFKRRTLEQIADMICGNFDTDQGPSFFAYRSSSYLTEFFTDADTEFVHDGSTRKWWVCDVLEKVLDGPQDDAFTPPAAFQRIIATLMDQGDALNEGPGRPGALALLNAALQREGFEAFYAEDKRCYLRHIKTATVARPTPNPHRPFSAQELQRRDQLAAHLDRISEDELIEEVLLPLLRQLGFHRITAAGHRDKQLEYGKDIWMRYVLPTQHVLYFGAQVKKGKLDAAGVSQSGNSNVAEIPNQALMMLGHEIFDPETNRKVLVDHAFIVAGGEITKAARNWLGQKLDASRRSQVMFMDREDILSLYIVTNLPLPKALLPPEPSFSDDIPF
ncbi:hypothetical protein Rumeso_02482 [Rubellimicrobium mesophilum DSM 19309]|uniref:Restriction endonuclease n=1 Tax=Rubellimicrobium mesophilum DSM 19309 TaxID=442562 RepID=A0A017HN79_9RHOB|nr:hypothetical protein [Rubellimicrobium mesophilum]EYD75937.1 hypothetical protein Rumeso_02482 [Rubellimicrobium mesophilum DSM 19309]